MTTEVKEKARPINTLVDVTVEADLSNMIWRGRCQTQKDRADALKRAVKEFHDFLRDHRSQDMVSLEVKRIYGNLCSVCHDRWETMTIDDKLCCACCGAEVEEQK